MSTAQTRSDIDQRTASRVSTSSHTHVDYPDTNQQSPRTKIMTSTKHVEQSIPPPPQIAQAITDQATDTPQPSTDFPEARQPSTDSNRKDRPPPPKCMQNCITSIDSCTQNVIRFNERMEQSRAQADAQREEHGDPIAARKAIIPVVFIILSWVFLVYVWRLCSRLIQQDLQGVVLGSRSEGIGLLVGFVLIWLMTIWSYVTVISKGPGLVKDYIPESDPPLVSAPQGGAWNDAPAQNGEQRPQNAAGPVPIPGQAHLPSNNDPAMQASDTAFSLAPAPATSASLPYPSFNADLERFGGYRASSDSMRVLPGSVEPEHEGMATNPPTHSRGPSGCTVVEEEAAAARVASTAGIEAQLGAEMPPPTDDVDASDPAADPQLPGVIGSLAAAAVAQGQGAREGAEALDHDPRFPPPAPAPPSNQQAAGDSAVSNSSAWSAPQRRPQNDPPPLSPAALYCHRCRRVKPPRAHHCRRCGTCVLKMDHHCPWVGGCVGAHNQRFFFIFVFWETLLEVYTLVTTAIFFHRGVRSPNNNSNGARRGAWEVDGFLISLFPICTMFLLFTGALLCTHVFLMSRNMTTIEHVGVSRMQGKERVLVERWFGMQSRQNKELGSKKGKGGFGGLNLKAKRRMVKEWDHEWGSLTKEGNRWWLGSSAEVTDYHRSQPNEERERGREGADAMMSSALLYVIKVETG